MRKINAGSAILLAALGVSGACWADLPAHQEPRMLVPVQAKHFGVSALPSSNLQVAAYTPPASNTKAKTNDAMKKTPASVTGGSTNSDRSNMGMMVLVGLGMVATVMFKSKKS